MGKKKTFFRPIRIYFFLSEREKKASTVCNIDKNVHILENSS